jgi:hypothetical protein
MKALKEQISAAKTKARTLKTRKAQDKAWKTVQELEHQALTILYAQRDAFRTHSVKAKVRWFHACDDYVSLFTPYGTQYGSPTSDVVSKSWYGSACCVEYTEGQEVIVELEVEVDSERLCLQVIPKRIYGGKLNEVQYAELCKNPNLAFFKYPGTDEVTGLFATGAGLW